MSDTTENKEIKKEDSTDEKVKTSVRETSIAFAIHLLQKSAGNPDDLFDNAAKIVFSDKVPQEVVAYSLEETMPEKWRKNENLINALEEIEPNTLRAILALSAAYWHLGFSKGFYAASLNKNGNNNNR